MKQLLTTLTLVGSLALSACTLAENTKVTELAKAETSLGEKMFSKNCGICHNPGEMGTVILAKRLGEERAVLSDRTDLVPAFINYVVRNGLLGMPLFNRGTLSDEELEAVVGYLTTPKAAAEAGNE